MSASGIEHDEVIDRATFVRYLARLRAELAAGPSEEGWTNLDLPGFLEAMQAWASDCPEPAQANPWRHAADVLTAATIYE